MSKKSFTYLDSGVNISLGNHLVKKIIPYAKATFRPGVLSSLGGFGAFFELIFLVAFFQFTHFNCKLQEVTFRNFVDQLLELT